MQSRTIAVVAVALLVVFSGCSAHGGSQANGPSDANETEPLTDSETGANGSNSTTTDTDDGADPNGTDGNAGTADGNDTANADGTADATWSPPEEPNRPLEDKREDRIDSVEFVDTQPAESGDGYSNFNLEVTANTSMENVDPPEHGDVVGEPYFFVKINEDEQKLIERTGEVRMDENGTYHIDVRPDGIEGFGEGSLTVEVFLMDEDTDWDDIYDSVGTDIQYNPDAGADDSNTTATDSESDSSET
ncbi:hypothetical protein [Natrinema versiforme]|uniref:Uncharacterized protein n=1 Tax=Natrinema versiforme JCM 10478 TaxID=1227496 RepID=L9Y409_9EURY|nr:hypothetical protein [Natrinema versiforme]ELY68795.1 hypothetical protein C489_06828 [Natrinema versiforme JCM 10478]